MKPSGLDKFVLVARATVVTTAIVVVVTKAVLLVYGWTAESAFLPRLLVVVGFVVLLLVATVVAFVKFSRLAKEPLVDSVERRDAVRT